ncbi:uncharacterized protein [Alexandromys fortis]|uniref:uncharacterized protein n=1 Tax=Alexandromys fortis TaxID=100897 RepID=UPI0021521853|nr:uncharacterized protein LOC126500470 [Microtus fortis]
MCTHARAREGGTGGGRAYLPAHGPRPLRLPRADPPLPAARTRPEQIPHLASRAHARAPKPVSPCGARTRAHLRARRPYHGSSARARMHARRAASLRAPPPRSRLPRARAPSASQASQPAPPRSGSEGQRSKRATASAGRGKLLGGSGAHSPGDGGLASFHNARQSRTAHPCCDEASARAVVLLFLTHHLLQNSILFKGIDLTKFLLRNLGKKVFMMSRGVGTLE